MILRSEIAVLVDVLEEGIKNDLVKPIEDLPLVAANIFFGSIVMISQTKRAEVDIPSAVDIMVDRIMNGHKK